MCFVAHNSGLYYEKQTESTEKELISVAFEFRGQGWDAIHEHTYVKNIDFC